MCDKIEQGHKTLLFPLHKTRLIFSIRYFNAYSYFIYITMLIMCRWVFFNLRGGISPFHPIL